MSEKLTENIMNKIVRAEKRRNWWWLAKFITAVLGLLIILAIFLWVAALEIIKRDVWDLVTLFGADPEIIQEYWQDTLVTIWEELPHQKLFLAGVFAIVLVGIAIIFRKRLRIVLRKLGQVKLFEETERIKKSKGGEKR